jgi:SAM-dependent methyltransferase
MQADFAPHFLRCPACHSDRTLALAPAAVDTQEVREGELICSVCDTHFPVTRGVGDLLYDPPEHVRREAAGLARFAEVMASQDWGAEKILTLPNVQDGYWYVQSTMFGQLLARLDLQPGQSLLDLGSNTCWATSQFAERGLRAIALDIATVELQGLYTADLYFGAGRRYFERIVGTMNDIPIASGSLDYVFCCEVLHHNDPEGLRKTFEEAFRVLKPGGKLLVINETLKYLRDRDGVNVEGVEQFEGYEHAHWAAQYRFGAIRAGFRHSRLIQPVYSLLLHSNQPRPDWRRHPVGFLRHRLRYNPVTRIINTMWLFHVAGGVQFSMIASKP